MQCHAPRRHTYAERPLLLFWKMTRTCPLACTHCRACAQHTSMPGELSTQEASRFLRDVAGFGSPSPILVMTGGDPLARADLFDLTAEARGNGTRVALAPAVSPSLAGRNVERPCELGVNAISISLDGAFAATHDGIRGLAGHFAETIAVMRRNSEELADIAALLRDLRVHVWEVFFLVHVGRGMSVAELGPHECEDVAHFLYESACFGFIVRTVACAYVVA